MLRMPSTSAATRPDCAGGDGDPTATGVRRDPSAATRRPRSSRARQPRRDASADECRTESPIRRLQRLSEPRGAPTERRRAQGGARASGQRPARTATRRGAQPAAPRLILEDGRRADQRPRRRGRNTQTDVDDRTCRRCRARAPPPCRDRRPHRRTASISRFAPCQPGPSDRQRDRAARADDPEGKCRNGLAGSRLWRGRRRAGRWQSVHGVLSSAAPRRYGERAGSEGVAEPRHRLLR